MKSIRSGRRQYGVLPFRLDERSTPELLLMTSRGTGRWVIPKGWPMRRTPHKAAALLEAYEEAGLRGEILGKPVGSYRYLKPELSRQRRQLEVRVFLMRVTEQLAAWPEQHERRTAWFSPNEAAAAVAEPDLAKLIRRAPRALRRRPADKEPS